MGQDQRTADLLVGVPGVNAQLDMDLDGLVKLGFGGLKHDIDSFVYIVKLCAIVKFSAFCVILSSAHLFFLL